jgi:hypothetical protein
MSRISRLREYAKPTREANWQGASRDQANIDRWSERAAENSDGADHRGSSGEVKLPDTGKRMDVRSTKSAQRTSAEIDARMRGKDDLNFVGDSSYMAGIRRNA